MTARFTTPVRMLGLTLLILACSPVTAPFSTFDLVSWLGGAPAAAGASLQPKKAADEPAAVVPGQTGATGVICYCASLLPRLARAPRGLASLHRPLRI